MSDKSRNRPDSKKTTDDWLTPPELVEAAGPFSLDPCCHPRMPWRTAATMVTLKADKRAKHDILVGDGLAMAWSPDGALINRLRVFCNPPYSDILPWAEKMARHGNGMLLVPAKSTDTKWGQHVLENMTTGLFFKGRLLFHFPNGEQSEGAWGPSILAAYDSKNVDDDNTRALERVRRLYPGVVLINADKQGATE